jgi:carbamate kinase
VKWLLEKGTIVICAGGGGIPTMYLPGTRTLVGAQVVVDKDRASALLARELEADVLVMATDADAVYADWGTPAQRPLGRVTPQELERYPFAAGSMGPKVEAACEFVSATGRRAAIGALAAVEAMVEGTAGTQVVPTT